MGEFALALMFGLTLMLFIIPPDGGKGNPRTMLLLFCLVLVCAGCLPLVSEERYPYPGRLGRVDGREAAPPHWTNAPPQVTQ